MKIKALLLLLLLSIFTSCSYEKKLERADNKIERLVNRFPELNKVDTIVDTIRVVVEEVKYDTSFVDTTADTIYIEKDKLRIRYVRNNDTVFISGECIADTIYQEVKVPVEHIVVQKEGLFEVLNKKVRNYIWLIIGGVVLFFGIKYAIKIFNPLS